MIDCKVDNITEKKKMANLNFWNPNADPLQLTSYAKFRRGNDGLNYSFLAFIIALSSTAWSLNKDIVCSPLTWYYRENIIVECFTFLSFLLRILPGWVLILCEITEFNINVMVGREFKDFVIVSFAISISMILMLRSIGGTCEGTTLYCLSGSEIEWLPTDTLLSSVVGISYLQVSLKGSSWHVILVAWLIELTSLILSHILSRSLFKSQMVIYVFMMSLFTMFEYENQLYYSFLDRLRHENMVLGSVSDNNEKKLADLQTKEIQFLVANTAHDLKTPLQAIGMGADDISNRLLALPLALANMSQAVTSALVKPVAGKTENDYRQHYILCCSEHDAILETVEIVSATVAFMSMTINRALDFTKVSNGILLVPSYETINLEAVLAWPASILTSLQGRISLEIEPIPLNICRCLITDQGKTSF